MTKRFVQCVCMGLTVCMLSTAMPFTGIAQEVPASSAAPTQTVEAAAPSTPEATKVAIIGEGAASTQATETVPATVANAATELPPADATELPSTGATELPPTGATEVPPTDATEVPPTDATEVPPTGATEVPPIDATEVPAIDATVEPATGATEVPATGATEVPATGATEVPATGATEVPATDAPAIDATKVPADEAPAEPTPEVSETPAPAIVSFVLDDLPGGIAVPYGTEETDLDLPTELTASFSDGTSAPVAVVWTCVDDGNGYAAYNPMPEDPAALFTFQAALAEDIPCGAELPLMGVVFMDAPMLLSAEELEQFGLSGDGEYTIDGSAITLTSGAYTVGSTTATAVTINLNGSGVSLTANADINGSVHVSSGTLNVNSAAVDHAILEGSASLNANDATLGDITMGTNDAPSTGECSIYGGTVNRLDLTAASGEVDLRYTSITTLSGIEKYADDIANKYWPKDGGDDRLPAAGAAASNVVEETYSIYIPNFYYASNTPFTITYMPAVNPYPAAGTEVQFAVTIENAEAGFSASTTITRKTADYIAPLTLTGGTIRKTYDGKTEISDLKIYDPTWEIENWDGSVSDYTGEVGDVYLVNPNNYSATDVGTYELSPYELRFPEAPQGATIDDRSWLYPTLTFEIVQRKVRLSSKNADGTIYRYPSPTTLAELEGQIQADGLAEGESLTALGDIQLMGSCDGQEVDLLAHDMSNHMGETFQVTSIATDPDSNYDVAGTIQNVTVYTVNLKSVTMDDYFVGLGALPAPEPKVELDLNHPSPEGRSVKYEYALEGTDDWSDKKPTTPGTYQIRVTFGACEPGHFPEEVVTDTFTVTRSFQPECPEHVTVRDSFEVKVNVNQAYGIDPNRLQSGRIEVGFLNSLYPGSYRNYEGGNYFSATIQTDDVKECKLYEMPVTLYLPVSEGSTELQEYPCGSVYVTIDKQDISGRFSANKSDGSYEGLDVSSGAMISMGYTASAVSLDLTKDVDFTITRNGGPHTPLKGELVQNYDSVEFYPFQAGTYKMTVKVMDSNQFYAGSCTAECTVAKRVLSIKPKETEVLRGSTSFEPDYDITDGSLAGNDTLYGRGRLNDDNKDLASLKPGEKAWFFMSYVWIETTYDGQPVDVTTSYKLNSYSTYNRLLTIVAKQGNFVIVIPSDVTVLDNGATAIECTAMDPNLDVSVTVNSTSYFNLRKTGSYSNYSMNYGLYRGDEKVGQDGEVARFTAANQSQALTFDVWEDRSLPPGDYTDTLTFTAKIN